jgi:hypothetical protein
MFSTEMLNSVKGDNKQSLSLMRFPNTKASVIRVRSEPKPIPAHSQKSEMKLNWRLSIILPKQSSQKPPNCLPLTPVNASNRQR